MCVGFVSAGRHHCPAGGGLPSRVLAGVGLPGGQGWHSVLPPQLWAVSPAVKGYRGCQGGDGLQGPQTAFLASHGALGACWQSLFCDAALPGVGVQGGGHPNLPCFPRQIIS